MMPAAAGGSRTSRHGRTGTNAFLCLISEGRNHKLRVSKSLHSLASNRSSDLLIATYQTVTATASFRWIRLVFVL